MKPNRFVFSLVWFLDQFFCMVSVQLNRIPQITTNVILLRHGQASLPPEGLQAFWREDLRKCWGQKLLSSSSPEELNEVCVSELCDFAMTSELPSRQILIPHFLF